MIAVARIHALVAGLAPNVSFTLVTVPEFRILKTSAKPWIR